MEDTSLSLSFPRPVYICITSALHRAKSNGHSRSSSYLTLRTFDTGDHVFLPKRVSSLAFQGTAHFHFLLLHWLLLSVLLDPPLPALSTLVPLGSVLGCLPFSVSFRSRTLNNVFLKTLHFISQGLTSPLSFRLLEQSSQHLHLAIQEIPQSYHDQN